MQRDFMFLGDPEARAEDTLLAFISDMLDRHPGMSAEEARQRILADVPELRAAINHDQDGDNDASKENQPHEGAHDSMDRRRLEAAVLAHKKAHPGVTDREARQAVHRAHPEWKHFWRARAR